MRLDAKLDPPLSDRHVVMGGVRLNDPLEQHIIDNSLIEQLASLFERSFRRYPKASALGIASILSQDEGGLSLAAVNRMIAGAVAGVPERERVRD